MKRGSILRLVASAILLAALAACGGGGDGTTTTTTTTTPLTPTTPTTPTTPAAGTIDKYIGTWLACAANGANSELETLVLTKTSETTANFSSTTATHTGAGCTGAATATESGSGSVTWTGTKMVGLESVDKIVITMGTATEKQIATVRSDGKFYTGIPVDEAGSNPDAEGYPSAFDTDPLTKSSATPTTPTTPSTPLTPLTPVAATVDKYVGTWRSCAADGAGSEQETLVLTKTSDTTVNFSSTVVAYSGAGCTGTVLGTGSGSGTVTWVGTKTVGAETVDKINITMGAVTEKQIAVIRTDGKFYSGIATDDPAALLDAQGYPSVLSPVPYSKI